jgi:hypothetical protein
MLVKGAAALLAALGLIAGEQPQLKRREPLPKNGVTEFRVEPGHHIAVKFVTTLTVHTASPHPHVYLQVIFPVSVSDRVVMPAGSFLDAEMLDIHRSGRVKGRAELEIRLDRMTLPNGNQRRLHSDFCVQTGNPRWSCPAAAIEAPYTMRAADAVFTPGTTADIVVRDALVFTPEDVASGAESP